MWATIVLSHPACTWTHCWLDVFWDMPVIYVIHWWPPQKFPLDISLNKQASVLSIKWHNVIWLSKRQRKHCCFASFFAYWVHTGQWGNISAEYIFVIKTTPDTPALPVLLSASNPTPSSNVQQQQRNNNNKKKGERSVRVPGTKLAGLDNTCSRRDLDWSGSTVAPLSSSRVSLQQNTQA